MKLEVIAPDDYRRRRRRYIRHFSKAIRYGDQRLYLVEAEILSRKSKVLTISDPGLIAVMVFKTVDKILHITLFGGAMPVDWIPEILGKLRLLADMHGCTIIQLKGRRAWERLLGPYGFHMKQSFLQYEVSRYEVT